MKERRHAFSILRRHYLPDALVKTADFEETNYSSF